MMASTEDSDDKTTGDKPQYTLSASCKLCGLYFEDDIEYRTHLQQHFAEDESRTWNKCQCDSTKKWRSIDFMGHLCNKHGHSKIFHCALLKKGVQCTYSTSRKSQ